MVDREARDNTLDALRRLEAPESISDCVRDPSLQFRLPSVAAETYTPQQVATDEATQDVWDMLAAWLREHAGAHATVQLLNLQYEHLRTYRRDRGDALYAGLPLLHMGDIYEQIGWPWHAQRSWLLSLCEAAVVRRGEVGVETGALQRFVSQGASEIQVLRLAQNMWDAARKYRQLGHFPELVVGELHDDEWYAGTPSSVEAGGYPIARATGDWLVSRLGNSKGVDLERLAQYLLSCIPGCRTYRREETNSTDLDVVAVLDGPQIDFRSEFGRYLVCECKDWARRADVTTLLKFGGVLAAAKCRFGVLFSSEGLSGEGASTFGDRERLKLYQAQGIAIAVVSRRDIERCLDGVSFLSILRRKYEELRLDLKRSPE